MIRITANIAAVAPRRCALKMRPHGWSTLTVRRRPDLRSAFNDRLT